VTSAFLTGGTGFVGGALLQRLVAAGYQIRALARTAAGCSLLEDAGASPILGDLSLVGPLTAAAEDCELVFHVAGVNEMCSRSPRSMFETNVTGTRNVVRAAAAAGARRVVFTSSAAALGERHGTVGDEDSEHRGRYLSQYERSKRVGEITAFTTGDRAGVEVVAVNPSSVHGPGRLGGSARLLLKALRAGRPWLVDSVVSFVDVADCSEGHLLAATRGRAGSRYVLNGASLRVGDLVAMMQEVAGVEVAPRMVPRWLARTAGFPAAWAANRLGRSTALCPEVVRTLLHGHRYDGSRAERELGLAYTAPQETVRRTVDWYRAEGLL
jgi:dihydroflavonol-4-reductase